jgi:hypothetical protein
VEMGRIAQQPRVTEGRSRLAHEVRRLDGPAQMPNVRVVPRFGGRGGGRGAVASAAAPRTPQVQPARPAARDVGVSVAPGPGTFLAVSSIVRRKHLKCLFLGF